jgi:cell division septation protein DedD
MAIEKDIRELLYDHDLVIVPELGGLLTHYRPARLDEARNVVHPPGKDLSFNRNLLRNDGLLADRISKREGIGFDQATGRIAADVNAWQQGLQRNGRVELPLIGIFYRDAEHNLQFDPDPRGQYLKDAHGLRPVAAVPVQRTEGTPVIALPIAAPVEEASTGRRTTWVWAAAAVAGLLFTAAALWAYRMGGPDAAQWSGFDPFADRPERTYVALEQVTPPGVSQVAHVELPKTGTGTVMVELVPEENIVLHVDLGTAAAPESTAVAVPSAEPVNVRARFHVIGGCFAQPENADRLLNELVAKGYPAVRLPKNGDLHPVAFGSYVDRASAQAAMSEIRAVGGGSAWLLVR